MIEGSQISKINSVMHNDDLDLNLARDIENSAIQTDEKNKVGMFNPQFEDDCSKSSLNLNDESRLNSKLLEEMFEKRKSNINVSDLEQLCNNSGVIFLKNDRPHLQQ